MLRRRARRAARGRRARGPGMGAAAAPAVDRARRVHAARRAPARSRAAPRCSTLARPAAVLGAGGGATVFARRRAGRRRSRDRRGDVGHRRRPPAGGALARRDRSRRSPGSRGSALEATGHHVSRRARELSHARAHRGSRSCCCAARSTRRQWSCTSDSTPAGSFAKRRPGAAVSLVPAMVARLVRDGAELDRFGVVLVGGGALDPSLRAEAESLGATIVETYGLTESCGGVVYGGVAVRGHRCQAG